MSENQYRYKAFISYSHTDRIWAEWLLKSLESYKIPKDLAGTTTDVGVIPEQIGPIFRDRNELPAAHGMTSRLIEALHGSEYLIVLCSPRAAQSSLVNREIAEFKRIRGDGHVLCMIIEGTPFSGDLSTECFPEALLHSFHRDGERTGLAAEGVAADIRSNGDGKRMALLKVIAGMIGVGLNDLAKREERRRQRRLTFASIAALISLVTLGSLVYQAKVAEEHARTAQALAERHADDLEIARVQGEKLVTFLTTTVYRELETVGKINVLETTTNKILQYYESQPVTSVSEDTIRARTIALFRLGQTLDRSGHTEEARKVFTSTLNQTRKALSEFPDNPTLLHRHQIALFFSAYLDHRTGQFDSAYEKYAERIEVARRGEAIDPDRKAWLDRLREHHSWTEQVAEAETSMGALLAGPLNKTEQGLAYLESGIKKRRVLVAELPDNLERKFRLATSCQYLGRAYQRLGHINKAQAIFEEQQQIYALARAKDPENLNHVRRHFINLRNLASLARDQGDVHSAKTLFSKAADGHDILAEHDPNNILWQANAARAYYQLAETLMQLGDNSSAISALDRGRIFSLRTNKSDATRPERRLVGYQLDLLAAQLAFSENDHEVAVNSTLSLLRNIQQENEAYLRVVGAAEHLAKIHILYAVLLLSEGQPATARQHQQTAIQLLKDYPHSIYAQNLLAQAHRLEGNHQKADNIRDHLRTLGVHTEYPNIGQAN